MSETSPKREFELAPFMKEHVPDPNGDPVALSSGSKLGNFIRNGLVAVAGGTGMILLGELLMPCSFLFPCVGATRSARLLREQRQQEVAEAITQFEAAHPTTPASEDAAQ